MYFTSSIVKSQILVLIGICSFGENFIILNCFKLIISDFNCYHRVKFLSIFIDNNIVFIILTNIHSKGT